MRYAMVASILLCACGGGTDGGGDLVSPVVLHGQAIIAGGELYGLNDQGVISLSLDGKKPVLLAPLGRLPDSSPFHTIALNDSEVFWSDSAPAVSDFTIKAVSRQGGASLPTISSGFLAGSGMALDETWVYWTLPGHGLYRVRR
jgi:hypothetical protein